MTQSENITTNLNDHRILLNYDTDVAISKASSRMSTSWKNGTIKWSQLLKKLSVSAVTGETAAEYKAMPVSQKGKIKDIGGFVGGHLRDGKRRTGYVERRQVITLDADNAPGDLWDKLYDLYDSFILPNAMCVYSTHSHTEKTPRYRIIIPLDRAVNAEQYEAIARKVASKIDESLMMFDDTTYEPTRLMYWPSHPVDVEPVFKYIDADILCADDILNEYTDWRDVSYWPRSGRQSDVIRKSAEQQGDPTAKKGVIGGFCRMYSVTEAMEKFLPGVYVSTGNEGRMTFAGGSTFGGVVIYQDGLFSYSHHSTDPTSCQLVNAFDLVRIHKFGHLDSGEEEKITDRESYKEMIRFAADDEHTKLLMFEERRKAAEEDFADPVEGEEDENWQVMLSVNKAGVPENTAENALIIMQHDPSLRGMALNELTGGVEAPLSLPWSRPNRYWSDRDDHQLFLYIATRYGQQFTDRYLTAAWSKVTSDRRFNPLRSYVENLPVWDGEERVDTLFIDYLGAEDEPYTRAVTRKSLVGAIKRVLEPGCKFDTVLVLDGKPGIGKSTILSKLGSDWFSDSLSLADTHDKTAAEKLQGVWIMEIGELQGSKKADIDILKGFLSRQVDEYRPAYGRNVERRPRTCIIFGTTNSTDGFLRDETGNRRFWPVMVSGGNKSVWDLTEDDIKQIWAEAKFRYSEGEDVFLDDELEKVANQKQREAMVSDEREGELLEYLDTLVPEDWYEWGIDKRVDYFRFTEDLIANRTEGTMRREFISNKEIVTECFGGKMNDFYDTVAIRRMMSKLDGWERTDKQRKIPGYGKQRIYERT